MLAKIKLYIKKIRSFFLTKKINQNISRYKYVHVMDNNKFNKPFVDFINKNFNPDEHMVLCYKKHPDKEPTLFPRGKNVYEYIYFKDIKGLLEPNIDKIIFHSLFMPGAIDGLYRTPELLKKSYWGIWGGDLYNAKRDEKNDFVRTNFKGYLTVPDKEEVIKRYNTNGIFLKTKYVFPISKDLLNQVKLKQHNNIIIQINNSCDESTLEMLDVLSKFKNENIKITTVLSYGKMQFKDEIIQKGKSIFGNKFEYLEKLISPKKYLEHLANNDILILNQNRQQGASNTYSSLYLGKKVFINDKSSTYYQLNNIDNVKVYNSNDIVNMSFEEFIKNDNIELNKQNISKYFDENEIKACWENVFNKK